jgi:hypothetical protein
VRTRSAARQLGDLGRADALGGGEVELVERLQLGEHGRAQALLDRGLGARGDLDGERFMQIVLVRPVLLARLASEVLERARERGHLELARLHADDVGDDRGAAHRPPPSRWS